MVLLYNNAMCSFQRVQPKAGEAWKEMDTMSNDFLLFPAF